MPSDSSCNPVLGALGGLHRLITTPGSPHEPVQLLGIHQHQGGLCEVIDTAGRVTPEAASLLTNAFPSEHRHEVVVGEVLFTAPAVRNELAALGDAPVQAG